MPFFSIKGPNFNKLILREKDVLIADEKALAALMNKYFVNITADLDLQRDSQTISVDQCQYYTRKISLSSKYFENSGSL